MEYHLINTIIGSIVAAFICGGIARKLKLPSILGFLVAGMIIGPYTPGFVADISLAKQLAEIGIILLMFGVGLHFSLRDLVNTRRIALPGALAQMFLATVAGAGVGMWLGYGALESVIFGFALSVASTIVLLRALEAQNLTSAPAGKIAISWLIIEDIAMVFALVMMPIVAGIVSGAESLSFGRIAAEILEVALKIGGFFLFMYAMSRTLLPWLIVQIAKMRSEELNTLGVLAIALGFSSVAYFAFDASLALGAFLAGVMLGESEIGRKSSERTISLRDTFSVLFFVSVGMLFDPHTLVSQPLGVLMTFLTIVAVKGAVAYLIASLLKQDKNVSYAVAFGLAQIGEFSFILGGLALTKGLLSQDLYNLILAGAMFSIVVNPFLFRLYDRRFGAARK